MAPKTLPRKCREHREKVESKKRHYDTDPHDIRRQEMKKSDPNDIRRQEMKKSNPHLTPQKMKKVDRQHETYPHDISQEMKK